VFRFPMYSYVFIQENLFLLLCNNILSLRPNHLYIRIGKAFNFGLAKTNSFLCERRVRY
jgi:hypothetical protein